LAHELVHAYDERRFKTRGQWGEDLRAHACTEVRFLPFFCLSALFESDSRLPPSSSSHCSPFSQIRAENLSGDCRWGREFTRRNWHFTKQHQVCPVSRLRPLSFPSPHSQSYSSSLALATSDHALRTVAHPPFPSIRPVSVDEPSSPSPPTPTASPRTKPSRSSTKCGSRVLLIRGRSTRCVFLYFPLSQAETD
jgi:hypothetical protein